MVVYWHMWCPELKEKIDPGEFNENVSIKWPGILFNHYYLAACAYAKMTRWKGKYVEWIGDEWEPENVDDVSKLIRGDFETDYPEVCARLYRFTNNIKE